MALGQSRVVVVAAVVVGAVGVLLFAGGNRGTPGVVSRHHGHVSELPAQGLFVVDTAGAQLVHTVALPAGLGGGDVGGGFGWLADDDGVLQLNQLTGSPVKTFPIAGGAAAVVYVGGKLWVKPTTSSSPATADVLKVDPQGGGTHAVFVPGSSDAIYRGGGYVWLRDRRHIDRIDPATGRIRRQLMGPAHPHMPCAATYADGALWIADARPNQLLKIDPRSLSVESHTRIPDRGEGEYCVTAGAGKVWVRSARGSSIYAFDPQTAHPIGLSLHVGRMHWMTGTDGALWFSTAKTPATLRAVTGDGTPVATVLLPTRPEGFEAFGTLLYASFVRET